MSFASVQLPPKQGPSDRLLHLSSQNELTGRLAVPRRGHVLSTATERHGAPIRNAVNILQDSLRLDGAKDYIGLGLDASGGEARVSRSIREEIAWRIASAWISGVAVGALRADATLVDSDRWFFGKKESTLLALVPDTDRLVAERLLQSQADRNKLFDLLPYVLDTHGPGSRLSVRRDQSTLPVRHRKRAGGIFYTPADVAEYMAAECLESLQPNAKATIFDPACGTGVYLRAALTALAKRSPKKNRYDLACASLYGVDVDPVALDASAFVLLVDTWPAARATSPSQAWQRLRQNLVCIDALRLDPARMPAANAARNSGDRVCISNIFPALKHGPSVIVGNPPYADVGSCGQWLQLADTLQTLRAKPKPTAEIYLCFVEQMIRLANRRHFSGSLVLPLSIACNTGKQFAVTRDLISRTAGIWRFAFFDREPHALFGEDVKTRNAILLWSRRAGEDETALATGPLRKWRGENRAAMFASLNFTRLNINIQGGVPKIEGDLQRSALELIEARSERLSQSVQTIERLPLSRVKQDNRRRVFVGPTAYNFLNVFLAPPDCALPLGIRLSEHPLHAISCSSDEDALATFAILSSFLVYWRWHALGDGFHVGARFIGDLPFSLCGLSKRAKASLCDSGEKLWNAIRSRPIVSVNGGRTSLAYTPNGHDALRRGADEVLADTVGLSREFVDELQKFTMRSVSARLHGIREREVEQS